MWLNADPAVPNWANAGNEQYGGPSEQTWVEPAWEDPVGSWNQQGWEGAGGWQGFQTAVPMQAGRGEGIFSNKICSLMYHLNLTCLCSDQSMYLSSLTFEVQCV